MNQQATSARTSRQLFATRILLAVLCLMVALIDASIPTEVNSSTLYLAILCIAYAWGTPKDVAWMAMTGLVLIFVGYSVSLDGLGEREWGIPLLNRVLMVLCLGVAAWWATRVMIGRARLSEREDYCTSIVQSSLDAMISMDASGRVIDWNPQAEVLFGYRSEEAFGRELAELIIPERFREAHRRGVRNWLETGESNLIGRRLHLPGVRKDGKEFPLELSVGVISHRGKPAFNAFLRDITQQELDSAYRNRMGELVESSWDAIIARGPDGTIESWNAGATRTYGYLDEEVLGKDISFLLPAGQSGEEPEITGAMASGRRLAQFETYRCRKDGVVIPVSITVSPIRDHEGNIVGSSSIERDISIQREREVELQLAKASAERANQFRADFLANVSHELRTPMNAVIGMTQLALSGQISDEAREYISTANRAAHNLLALLNDILDYSRLESGKFTIVTEPFFLRSLVAETTATLANLALTKGIRLTTHIGEPVPRLLIGDGLRLRQILLNLLGNAIKFTPAGEVTLRVTQLDSDEHRIKLRFAVKDTGVGISPADQQRILKPFEQVDASRSRAVSGTGLGLAITSELLALMGSELSVESRVGQGSEFTFDLWLETGKEDFSPEITTASIERLRHLHVLVVGEPRGDENHLATMIARWDMRVETAGTRPQAIRMAEGAARRHDPYQLIMVIRKDLSANYATSRPFWTEEAVESIPMIKVLRDDEEDLTESGQELPPHVAFLREPVSPSLLLETIVRVRSTEPAARENVPPPETTRTPEVVRPLSVLLAEDVAANQQLVNSVLGKRGHRVTIATNGSEAVERFRNTPFDVVLMDVQMPGMDGYEAARAIRDLEQGVQPGVPIIAMTAHAFGEDRDRCLAAGMDDYVSKPFDITRLISVVESHAARATLTGRGSQLIPLPAPKTSDGKSPSPAPPSLSSLFNAQAALQRLDGDWDLFQNLAGYFAPDCRASLELAREGMEKKDSHTVYRAAHTIRGLAATFDGRDCVAAAESVESLALKGEWAQIPDWLDRLDKCIDQLATALRRYLAERDAALPSPSGPAVGPS